MEASDKKDLNQIEQLNELFGSYKAEWLKGKLYDLFTEPAYFPELKTARPCVLIGGRGTGKTTVLRCLSYEGQFAISGRDPEAISEWPSYGMYYRVNTNRVTAFKGPELEKEKWISLFAHYFNLLTCELLFRFLEWYQSHLPNMQQLDVKACVRIAKSLNLEGTTTIRDLTARLDILRIDFEAYINNIESKQMPPLSMQGVPIDILAEEILKLPQFKGKNLFFLLDEYENFEDYQQQIVNTLIKHSGQLYSFKIGVRELGLRCRSTLNPNEQLVHPADYVRINISEKLDDAKFKAFAYSVCNARISKLKTNNIIKDIALALPELTETQEAEKLGINEAVRDIKTGLISSRIQDIDSINRLSSLEIYFLDFWARSNSLNFEDALKDFEENRTTWETRFQNYKYALLFTIKRGKRGIRKYYAGWDVFNKLAARNIRYLLELVDQSFLLHIQDGQDLSKPISAELQTRAAQNVGQKNLSELEGLSVHGAKLTKLLLGLGRIFQVMAVDLSGHAPEVNQLYFEESSSDSEDSLHSDLESLLVSAVMHLALLRFPGNKLTDESDTKNYDYMVHPIFSPFFEFSYRKKRKMKLTGKQFLGLVSRPRETIKDILEKNNRQMDESLPEQLNLFEGYYFGHS